MLGISLLDPLLPLLQEAAGGLYHWHTHFVNIPLSLLLSGFLRALRDSTWGLNVSVTPDTSGSVDKMVDG